MSTMRMIKKDKGNDELFDDFKKVFPTNEEGMCYHNLDIVVIFLKDFKDTPYWYSVLSHEIQHAVQFVLEMLNTPMCRETSETYAYYNGFIHRKIYEQLWDPKFITKQTKQTKQS